MSAPCRVAIVASLAGCLRRALSSALTAALGVHMRKRRTSTTSATSNLSRSSRTAQAILVGSEFSRQQVSWINSVIMDPSTELRSIFFWAIFLCSDLRISITNDELDFSGVPSRNQRAHPPRWRAWMLRVGGSLLHGSTCCQLLWWFPSGRPWPGTAQWVRVLSALPCYLKMKIGTWVSGLVVVSEDITESLKGFDWEPLHLLSDPWFDPENNMGPLFLKRYCQISCWSLLST